MYIHHATGRQLEQLGLEDVAVGDHHANIGSQIPQTKYKRAVRRLLRLEDRQLFGFGGDLHRGRNQRRAGAALRRVGLRDDGDHVESFTDERAQRGHREFWCTKERHAHLQLTRRLRRNLLEISGLSLARLLPFREQQAALHGAQVIEKQNAVEVVDLVLNGARLVAVRFDTGTLSFLIERLDDDAKGARDVAEDLRDRQAPLLGGLVFVTPLDDDGIDEHQGRRVLLADVHDGDTPRDADLVGGEADAFRGAHRFEQVVHELAHRV